MKAHFGNMYLCRLLAWLCPAFLLLFLPSSSCSVTRQPAGGCSFTHTRAHTLQAISFAKNKWMFGWANDQMNEWVSKWMDAGRGEGYWQKTLIDPQLFRKSRKQAMGARKICHFSAKVESVWNNKKRRKQKGAAKGKKERAGKRGKEKSDI